MKPEDVAKLPAEAQSYIKQLEARAGSVLAPFSGPAIARHVVQILLIVAFVVGLVAGHFIL